MSRRLLILDRDGVINHESKEFVKSTEEWLPIDGSIDAIARLSDSGYTVAVATNQSGIGRKLLDRPALEDMHDKLRLLVREAGGVVDRIVYCPHLPEDHCACRKPEPGLYRQLSRHYGVPLDGVPMIGDSARDIEAARAVNGRPILVLTGNGRETRQRPGGTGVESYADLSAAADILIAEIRGGQH